MIWALDRTQGPSLGLFRSTVIGLMSIRVGLRTGSQETATRMSNVSPVKQSFETFKPPCRAIIRHHWQQRTMMFMLKSTVETSQKTPIPKVKPTWPSSKRTVWTIWASTLQLGTLVQITCTVEKAVKPSKTMLPTQVSKSLCENSSSRNCSSRTSLRLLLTNSKGTPRNRHLIFQAKLGVNKYTPSS